MKLAFRDVLVSAFEYWNCAIREEERNIFRVQIEPGGVAERICEATGTIHIGVVEFEDDVVASYESWRSFTPGSYYLSRLLESLRDGPIVGRVSARGFYRAPDIRDVLSIEQFDLSRCRLSDQFEKDELVVAATTFHFAVSLLGLEPKTELISLTIEPIRRSLLPESKFSDPYQGEAEPCGESTILDQFSSVIKPLRVEIEKLLTQYKRERSRTTAAAIRKIREARRAELAVLPRNDQASRAKHKEVEEIWTIREQDARLRGEAERVDVSLVGATVEERPVTIYRGVVILQGARRRTIERLYDRSADWLEPLLCELCRQNVDLLTFCDGPCAHVICTDCTAKDLGCRHYICLGCSSKCKQCELTACPLCDPCCVNCEEISCRDHRVLCAICGITICSACNPPCLNCLDRFCMRHGVCCPVCRQVMCPEHKRHRTELGVFRVSLNSFQELGLRRVSGTTGVFDRAIKGRKSFLGNLKAVLGEEAFGQYKSLILENADRCYEIMAEEYLEGLIGEAAAFGDVGSASGWTGPFPLQKKDKEAALIIVSGLDPDTGVPLDDQNWWLRRVSITADPFLNEYGFLPSSESYRLSLDCYDSEEILKRGWFDHDAHSDPTYEDIPFYDPGYLEDLRGPNGRIGKLLQPELDSEQPSYGDDNE
jgi:hypothetical protein